MRNEGECKNGAGAPGASLSDRSAAVLSDFRGEENTFAHSEGAKVFGGGWSGRAGSRGDGTPRCIVAHQSGVGPMSLGRNLSKRIIGMLRGGGDANGDRPMSLNHGSAYNPSDRFLGAAIRLSSKVVILQKPISRGSFPVDERWASIYTKAFFQAWIKAQPSLSLSEFIDRFKAGDKTILEALDRERMTLPGHTLTPERRGVPRHVA